MRLTSHLGTDVNVHASHSHWHLSSPALEQHSNKLGSLHHHNKTHGTTTQGGLYSTGVSQAKHVMNSGITVQAAGSTARSVYGSGGYTSSDFKDNDAMQSNNKGRNESPFAAVRKFIECVEPSQGVNASDVSEGVIATSKIGEATKNKSDQMSDKTKNQVFNLSPVKGSNNSNWRSL